MLSNRENSKLHFKNIRIRGRSSQNFSMMFQMIFINALDFLISFVLAEWELDNGGAYFNPLKKQLLRQDPLSLSSSKYIAGRSLQRAG